LKALLMLITKVQSPASYLIHTPRFQRAFPWTMTHEVAPLDFIACVQGVEGEGEGKKRERRRRGRGEGEREGGTEGGRGRRMVSKGDKGK